MSAASWRWRSTGCSPIGAAIGWIHGDVKWENCLWRESAGEPITLKWIDWELTDLGDPAWDTGCFIQCYLSHWIRSLPPVTGLTLADRIGSDADLFSAMQPALRAFLEDYIAALQATGSEVLGLRERIMRCAAARMVQMGLEVMHGRPVPTPEALSLLENKRCDHDAARRSALDARLVERRLCRRVRTRPRVRRNEPEPRVRFLNGRRRTFEIHLSTAVVKT